ncbi:MAG: hypothetical protein ACI89L_000156 [Phycisphaerales bacterium]|jgi:hypothetical protein
MRPRPANTPLAVLAAGLLLAAALAPARAQSDTPPDPTNTELRRLGLDAVLAARLELGFDQIAAGDKGPARVEAAEALSAVYVRMLSDPESPIPIEEIRTRAQRLIDAVPGQATVGLRLTLAVARYASIETQAERHRYGVLDPAELPRVIDELARLRLEFDSTAKDLDGRVESLDRLRRGSTRRGREFDASALDEAVRFRSLSSYYAAWTAYYLSTLTGDTTFASSAIEDFGRLLDSPDETPTLDRLPRAMLRYDAVARSALGIAMCYAQLDQSDLSLNWIRELREAPAWPDHLVVELDTRTAQILLAAARWTELRQFLDRLSPKSNLSVADWMLCANDALTALESRTLTDNRIDAAEQLARGSLRYLIAEGHLALVLDIAASHPNLPLDGTGFAIKYVKGVEAYETAHRAHEARGEDTAEPTESPQVATLYRGAVRRLEAALQAGDASSFDRERVSCAHLAGQSLFAAGDLPQAAAMLERAYALAANPVDAEAPLWLAIAVLDRVEGTGETQAATKRNELAKVYLARYENTDRAGLLLLRLVGEDLIEPEKAIRILGEIPPDAVYANAANQYRATLIYTQWRKAPAHEQGTLTRLYLPLVASLIESDSATLEAGDADDPARVRRRLLLTARRALDVAVSSNPPSLDHAEQTLRRLTSVAEQGLIELAPAEAELTYRRVQIALRSDRLGQADEHLHRLRVITGPFADAAERLVYTDAMDRKADRPADPSVLRRVVVTGGYVLDQLRRDTKPASGTRASVMNQIADAANTLWTGTRDESMRGLALRLDTEAFTQDIAAQPAMLRLASLAEQTLKFELASEAWLRLMATSRPPDPRWFSARANSIRLLASTDTERAIAAIDQHVVLYPSLGPEREAAMIREAAAKLDHPIPGDPTPPANPSNEPVIEPGSP